MLNRLGEVIKKEELEFKQSNAIEMLLEEIMIEEIEMEKRFRRNKKVSKSSEIDQAVIDDIFKVGEFLHFFRLEKYAQVPKNSKKSEASKWPLTIKNYKADVQIKEDGLSEFSQ